MPNHRWAQKQADESSMPTLIDSIFLYEAPIWRCARRRRPTSRQAEAVQSTSLRGGPAYPRWPYWADERGAHTSAASRCQGRKRDERTLSKWQDRWIRHTVYTSTILPRVRTRTRRSRSMRPKFSSSTPRTKRSRSMRPQSSSSTPRTRRSRSMRPNPPRVRHALDDLDLPARDYKYHRIPSIYMRASWPPRVDGTAVRIVGRATRGRSRERIELYTGTQYGARHTERAERLTFVD
ncbi:unnamed protein product [Trichogramma brassicae]|uniref:Uncharacterized protein n=1 Tax=Trichogramma brassicae TaxID=86971 RepID=A0A6H5HVP9_9HYME|nr:unnamed protein product [Trichogramma brassicae]